MARFFFFYSLLKKKKCRHLVYVKQNNNNKIPTPPKSGNRVVLVYSYCRAFTDELIKFVLFPYVYYTPDENDVFFGWDCTKI